MFNSSFKQFLCFFIKNITDTNEITNFKKYDNQKSLSRKIFFINS